MKRLKRVPGALSIIVLSVAFAALATSLTAVEDDPPSFAEAVVTPEGVGQERRIDWDALPAEVIAWVEVPGTSIDEPIVQASASAPNAYLYIDALGQGAYGTPYIDCECTLDAPFVMIYGHHMSDGSVFADFARFASEAYALEHDEIILYKRGEATLHLKPIAVDVLNASKERLDLENPLVAVRESDLILDSAPNEAEQVHAFATCSYQTWNSRTIVYATEVNPSSQV